MKHSAEFLTTFKAALATMNTQLNAISSAELAEPFKTHYANFRDQLNGFLSKLAPLDQVPAANAASYGMDHLADCLLHAQEVITGMFTNMESLRCNHSTQLNALVEEAVAQQLKDGKILTPESSKELVDAAVKVAQANAESAAAAKYGRMEERRTQLNGLPEPSSEVMVLEDDDFKASLLEAKRRADEMKAKGIPVSKNFSAMPWMDKEEYDRQLNMLSEVMGGKGGSSRTQTGEPLLSQSDDSDQTLLVA